LSPLAGGWGATGKRPGRRASRALAITGLDTILTIRPATADNLTGDHQRGRKAVMSLTP
jgi:hypothetical protein